MTESIDKLIAELDERTRHNIEEKRKKEDFDVFLCHNSDDKPLVKKIGYDLIKKGILPWLDEWNLRPGFPWQDSLEKQIKKIGSAAVFIGEKNIGPWQNMELKAFLQEFVNRKCPVIPVLLPGCQSTPELPLFLKGMTWVDFRVNEPNPMERLIWGITGKQSTDSGEQKPFNFGPIKKKLCDRDNQDAAFKDEFRKNCDKSGCPGAAQFYIIHGDDGECHESLVQRFKEIHIRGYKNPQWREKNLLPRFVSFTWPPPVYSDIEKHKSVVKDRLFFYTSGQQLSRTDYSAKAFCTLPDVKKSNVFIISHSIQAESWRRHYHDLLKWYMTEYWSLPDELNNIPLILIFFNIIYPYSGEKGWLKRLLSWNYWRNKRRVRKKLKKLSENVGDRCTCLLLKEIEPVSRSEVDDWFRTHAEGVSAGERLAVLDSLFEKSQRITMAKAEQIIEEVFNKLDRQNFEKHYR